jgi:hypothetical protein
MAEINNRTGRSNPTTMSQENAKSTLRQQFIDQLLSEAGYLFDEYGLTLHYASADSESKRAYLTRPGCMLHIAEHQDEWDFDFFKINPAVPFNPLDKASVGDSYNWYDVYGYAAGIGPLDPVPGETHPDDSELKSAFSKMRPKLSEMFDLFEDDAWPVSKAGLDAYIAEARRLIAEKYKL